MSPFLLVHRFDLRATLNSGQVFRFDEQGGYFFLRVRDRVIRLRQEGPRLEYSGCDEAFLRDFFQLEVDLEAIEKELSLDPFVRKAMRSFPGLRVMRQDPWECLVCFICSSASNIPRIRRNIEGLCRLYGHPISLNGYQSFSFPEPGAPLEEEAMRRAGLGFRARYLAALTAGCHRGLDLSGLRRHPYEQAQAALMQLPGVGEKIADCVLLFSLGFSQAFPVDTWIKRVMQQNYFRGRKVSNPFIRQRAWEKFGLNAGYAQQYLFHYARMQRARAGNVSGPL